MLSKEMLISQEILLNDQDFLGNPSNFPRTIAYLVVVVVTVVVLILSSK